MKDRTPDHPPPTTTPAAPSSSSAWTMRVAVLTRFGILPVAAAEVRECIDERGRGRDGVPCCERCPGVHASERRGRIPVDKDRVPVLVHRGKAYGKGALEVLLRVVVPESKGEVVRVEERLLLREELLEEPPDHLPVDLQKRSEHSDIDDVLHQDTHAVPSEVVRGQPRHRGPEEGHVVPHVVVGERPRGVVEHPTACAHLLDVPTVRRGVHRHHEVESAAPGRMARPIHPDLVPRREALDVGGKEVLPANRDPHPEDRLAEESIRTRRTGPVDRPYLERKVVDPGIPGRGGWLRLPDQGSTPHEVAGSARALLPSLEAGIGNQQVGLPHVPGSGGTPLRAEPAVYAEVLILHHHAGRLR